MTARFDAFLVSLFQAAVDVLQLRPVVLARACWVVYTALIVFAMVRHPDAPAWLRILCSLGVVSMWFMSLTDARLASHGGHRFSHLTRAFDVVVTAAVSCAAVLTPDPVLSATVVVGLSVLGFDHFAACRPPRPRPPRHVASPAGAAP